MDQGDLLVLGGNQPNFDRLVKAQDLTQKLTDAMNGRTDARIGLKPTRVESGLIRTRERRNSRRPGKDRRVSLAALDLAP
jgi:hypothetical protein